MPAKIMAPLDWLDLSTAKKDISELKQGFGVISEEKPRFEVDLKKRNAILRNRNRVLKKDRDFHFRRCKQFKVQLDQLQKKYDELQNYFVASQLLKQLDESHKEIKRLKEIISCRHQENSQVQNLQLDEPFANCALTDLQTANVSTGECEEQVVKAEPQDGDAGEGEGEKDEEAQHPYNLQVAEPFANGAFASLHAASASIGEREEQVGPRESEKPVEISDVRSAGRELRIRLCRIPQEMCSQYGTRDRSESNPVSEDCRETTDLVCKWIHGRRGLCGREFRDAAELESHLEVDHAAAAKRTQYRCRWQGCARYKQPLFLPKRFTTHLERHVPQTANPTEIHRIPNATWSENTRAFNTRRSTWGRCREAQLDGRHEASSASGRVYKCPFEGCGRAFTSKANLKVHGAIHNKSIVCPYDGCGRTFARKVGLQFHVNWHTGERPYKCPYDGCPWSFANKTILYGHLKRHTGERPYACTFEGCGRRFVQKCGLRNHWQSHPDERPFKCTFDGCDMAFKHKCNLMSHLRVHVNK